MEIILQRANSVFKPERMKAFFHLRYIFPPKLCPVTVVNTPLEVTEIQQNPVPHGRTPVSEQNELLSPSLWLDITTVRLFLNFNSKHTDPLLFCQFSQQEKKRHVTVLETSKFWFKISVNKMLSDLAEILHAVITNSWKSSTY